MNGCKRKQVGLCWSGKGVAGNNRARANQYTAEPTALEAGMARYEHALALIKIGIKNHLLSHTFHGACPTAHSFSNASFSRTVSMHCQNPLCL